MNKKDQAAWDKEKKEWHDRYKKTQEIRHGVNNLTGRGQTKAGRIRKNPRIAFSPERANVQIKNQEERIRNVLDKIREREGWSDKEKARVKGIGRRIYPDEGRHGEGGQTSIENPEIYG